MLQLYQLICIAVFALRHITSQEPPIIKLSLGQVRGHYKQSCEGRTYSAYEGIPYAKPPLGDLRFAEPQPAEPWNGTWNATATHTCIQIPFTVNTVVGEEDCLYINVYVPRENPAANENLDVMVTIHGGALMQKNSDLCSPRTIMDRNLVHVNFNYRLGMLGFLCTEDEVVPGNNGMKDQVLALKWVQEHIARFGGNPKSVTLAGISIGSMSVYMHYFSPLSKGLFHRGISQSGTMDIMQNLAPTSRKVAASVDCYQSDSTELVQCLRRRPADQLIVNTYKEFTLPALPLLLFGITIERNSSNPFLTDHPYHLLNQGKVQDVPWLVSTTTEDMSLVPMNIIYLLDYVNDNWSQVAPDLLGYNLFTFISDKDLVSRKVREFYLKNESISLEVLPQLVKLFTDRYAKFPIEKAARLQAKVNKSPVYYYLYGYKATGIIEAQKWANGLDMDLGVEHCADAYFLYNMELCGMKLSCENITMADRIIKDLLLDIVTSFARNGYPEVEGVQWEPVSTEGDLKVLSIKEPWNVRMDRQKELAPTAFWESLSIPYK